MGRRGQAEHLPFAAGAFDMAFMGMVLHETADPQRVSREARRVSRSLVAVLEWPYPSAAEPEPPARRFHSEEMRALARQVGFGAVSLHPLAHMVLYHLSL